MILLAANLKNVTSAMLNRKLLPRWYGVPAKGVRKSG